jgi:phospholipid N-methyltransferase
MTPCEIKTDHTRHASYHGRVPVLGERDERYLNARFISDFVGGAHRGDVTTFFRSWLRHPLRTAAIAPSSRALARLMTRDIVASDRVVELGPGTGVFTRALLERGVPPSRLTLVEANRAFAELLDTRFVDSHVVWANAASSRWQLTVDTEIDAVVSGLPLLSMSAEEVSGVLSKAFGRLRPEGRFYQFTYGPKCPVRSQLMSELRLRATLVGRTVRNLPPASVYRIERRPD